jgi:AcrR family transcriptional regulator
MPSSLQELTTISDPLKISAQVTLAAEKRPRGRPRKTIDDRDDGNRRPALLQAAAMLFRRQGYAATTTRDIAAAAGMQSGSPFYHFKSKEALLYAVMEEGMRSAQQRQIAAIQKQDKKVFAQEQLRSLIQVHFEVLLGPGNDFVPVMLYESRSLQLRQRKQLAQLIADYEALWIPVLETLHANGQLRAPVGLARLLIFGAMNWSVQWFDARKSASLNDLSNAALSMFIKET